MHVKDFILFTTPVVCFALLLLTRGYNKRTIIKRAIWLSQIAGYAFISHMVCTRSKLAAWIGADRSHPCPASTSAGVRALGRSLAPFMASLQSPLAQLCQSAPHNSANMKVWPIVNFTKKLKQTCWSTTSLICKELCYRFRPELMAHVEHVVSCFDFGLMCLSVFFRIQALCNTYTYSTAEV